VRKRSVLHLNDRSHVLGMRTWIMGVLNVTPDSFSDGGLFFDEGRATARGLELAEEGADIIDVGGESTRPGSEPVPVQEELRRVVPVISRLRKETDALISVDTTKAAVAQAALEAGADMVNDISAFRFDDRMPLVVSEAGVPVILMHMKGVPRTMQNHPFYENLFQEILGFLEERISRAVAYGIPRERLIIDPGIGFGKNLEHNLSIIKNLHFLNDLERPILVGVSRKSFIGKILHLPPDERLEGTLASAVLSVVNGAHILRVHDVQEVRRAVAVADAVLGSGLQPPSIEEAGQGGLLRNV